MQLSLISIYAEPTDANDIENNEIEEQEYDLEGKLEVKFTFPESFYQNEWTIQMKLIGDLGNEEVLTLTAKDRYHKTFILPATDYMLEYIYILEDQTGEYRIETPSKNNFINVYPEDLTKYEINIHEAYAEINDDAKQEEESKGFISKIKSFFEPSDDAVVKNTRPPISSFIVALILIIILLIYRRKQDV